MDDQAFSDIVLSFTQDMNILQNKYYSILVSLEDKAVTDCTDVFDAFRMEQRKLYALYLTERKSRVYYGGISNPAKYAAINATNTIVVEHISKNRVEVIFDTSPDNSIDFLFVLLCKNGQWKIDIFKTKYRKSGRVWNYGSF